jgi:hypothetical protein
MALLLFGSCGIRIDEILEFAPKQIIGYQFLIIETYLQIVADSRCFCKYMTCRRLAMCGVGVTNDTNRPKKHTKRKKGNAGHVLRAR